MLTKHRRKTNEKRDKFNSTSNNDNSNDNISGKCSNNAFQYRNYR